jgi:hypothetical protein
MFGKGMVATLAIAVVLATIVLLESVRVVFVRRWKFAAEMWKGAADRRPAIPMLVAATMAALFVMNSCYPAGFVYQASRMLFRRRIAW